MQRIHRNKYFILTWILYIFAIYCVLRVTEIVIRIGFSESEQIGVALININRFGEMWFEIILFPILAGCVICMFLKNMKNDVIQ